MTVHYFDMQQNLAEIQGKISKISYQNKENGWTVVRLYDDLSRKVVTATGVIPNVQKGLSYTFTGEWVKHHSYGDQFKVDSFIPLIPVDEEGIVKYLSSGFLRGVREKTAQKIVAHFGLDTLNILDHDIKRLREIPSIKEKKFNDIVEDWRYDSAIRKVHVFLHHQNISQAYASKIIAQYGINSINVVKNSPYRLAIDIKGIGFKIADTIAQRVGIARDSFDRICSAIVYQLTQAEDNGHCFITVSQLLKELLPVLELDESELLLKFNDALDMLVDNGVIVAEEADIEDFGIQKVYYDARTHQAEKNVAERILAMLDKSFSVDQVSLKIWLSDFCQNSSIDLSEDQINAVHQAVSHRVFALTGGPGVGKTTTANAIIKVLQKLGKSVTLCAPTGRAAQRLSEVSLMPAKTIHRLLEWNPHDYSFAYNQENPLPVQVVIVDEVSMLDIHLSEALLLALKNDAQIIFIGDMDQLPSVGPGNFFRNIIESKVVPCAKLNQIFRQAAESKIIRVAHALNNGELQDFEDDPDSDCRFIEAETPEQIRHVIKALICKKIPEKYDIDPVRDIQVLTPMNKGGVGTTVLNKEIRELLNPKEDYLLKPFSSKTSSSELRVDDKVIQCSNNYELNVFNGDIGYVQHRSVMENKQTIVEYNDRDVSYKEEQLEDLKFAYAITIHKSQGSEFPIVIIPVTMHHFIMLQRNLFYTAVTRAKKLAVFVGSLKALNYAMKNQASQHRQTLLKSRLQRII